MRKHVLPEASYRRLEGGDWIAPDGERVPDTEVERHHARLMITRPELQVAAVRVVARETVKRVRRLAALLGGGDER